MPKNGLNVSLVADATWHGFSFNADDFRVYVLLETGYYKYKPRRGRTLSDHAKVYVQYPQSTSLIKVSNWADVKFDIPRDVDFLPIGYKYKTPPRYASRHVTIIPFPMMKGFGGVIERKSGGVQDVRMTFSVPARLRMQFGQRLLSFQSAFFFKHTIETKKLKDKYSRGSAIGFTTDLINSKDEPTHWGTVINGQSGLVQPAGPTH